MNNTASIDHLLDLPWWLDHRDNNPRRDEFLALKAQRDKERRDFEQRARAKQTREKTAAAKRAEAYRLERDKLEADKAARRKLRADRKANKLERIEDRAVVVELLRRPAGPRTIGQLDKACGLDRKRIMSALRWLKRKGRITTEGRRYFI